MKIGVVLKVLGALFLVLAGFLAFPLLIAAAYDETSALAFGGSMLLTGGLGALLLYLFRRCEADVGHREGFAVAALGWVGSCLLGALPFVFSGEPAFSSITDCVFESTSGFTTTGASILTDIEAIPRGLLFWRSLTHWLGGMGIIALSVALLPLLGVGGMQLFRAEVPGPTADKISPRVAETARLLWTVYVGISALEALLLWLGGMSWFESLCHTFGTMATGGFSTRNTSIAAYDSAYFDTVITIFMVAAGTNFALHYALLRRNWTAYFKDAEWRVYMTLFGGAMLALMLLTWLGGEYDSPWTALRYGAFQSAAILTTTGYATADFEAWGLVVPLAPMILFMFMFIGGCAGSTGGGMKVGRVWLLAKLGAGELYQLVHPRAVRPVKMNGRVVPPEVLRSITRFFILFMGLFALSVVAMSLLGLDFTTAISSVAASIGNIGPGLGNVGPTDNYGWVPMAGKWVLMLDMLLGRLEVYTILVLFVPELWRR